MDAEVKTKIEALGSLFEDYKKTNDEALAGMKANGHADAELEAKLSKMDTAMDTLQSDVTNAKTDQGRMDDLEASLNRLGISGGGAGGSIITPEMKEYKDAFNLYMRKGRGEEALDELARKATLSTDSDPDGGFTVLPEVDQEISRVQSTLSAMRGVARVIGISAAQYEKIVTISGASAGWVTEKQSRPKTDSPVLSKIIIEAMEMYAQPAATQTMLDDTFMNLEMWLAEEVGITFDETEGGAFITGNGVGKPRGVLDYDTVTNASYAWGKLGYVPTGAAGGFDATDPGDALIDLVYALRASYRQNGKFMMGNLTQAAVRKIQDGDGNYLWAPGLADGQPSTLLGYPVVEDENMPVIAANSYSISFGDWMRGYTIADRVGVRVLRDPYTDKPLVLFYTTKRVGGGVTNFEAIKLLKFAAS